MVAVTANRRLGGQSLTYGIQTSVSGLVSGDRRLGCLEETPGFASPPRGEFAFVDTLNIGL